MRLHPDISIAGEPTKKRPKLNQKDKSLDKNLTMLLVLAPALPFGFPLPSKSLAETL